jgi:hypothetical protein
VDDPPVDWRGAVDRLTAELEKIEQFSLEQVLADLITAVEIAAEHGFESPSIVWNYRVRYAKTRDPFPGPVATFGRIDVYWRPAINLWMTNHKRRKQTLTKAERELG